MSVPNYISVSSAVACRNAYKNLNGPLLINKNGGNYDPTDFIWIPLNELKALCDDLLSIRDKNNNPISGVRIYFGINNVIGKEDRETLFIAPTVDFSNVIETLTEVKLYNLPVSLIETAPNQIEYRIIDGLKNAADSQLTQLPISGNEINKICDGWETVPPPKPNQN